MFLMMIKMYCIDGLWEWTTLVVKCQYCLFNYLKCIL